MADTEVMLSGMDKNLATDLDSILGIVLKKPNELTRFTGIHEDCIDEKELAAFAASRVIGGTGTKYVMSLVSRLQDDKRLRYPVQGHLQPIGNQNPFLDGGGYTAALADEIVARNRRLVAENAAHEVNLLMIAKAKRERPWYKTGTFWGGVIVFIVGILALLFNPPFNWINDKPENPNDNREEHSASPKSYPKLTTIKVVQDSASHDSLSLDSVKSK